MVKPCHDLNKMCAQFTKMFQHCYRVCVLVAHVILVSALIPWLGLVIDNNINLHK